MLIALLFAVASNAAPPYLWDTQIVHMFVCGIDFDTASSTGASGAPCPKGSDEECFDGMKCFKVLK